MQMIPIPLFRAAHLLPYLNFLRHTGASVDHMLRATRLPVYIDNQPNLYLPLANAQIFLTQIARNEAIDNLGLRAASELDISDLSPEFTTVLNTAPTLYSALQAFCKLGHIEDDQVKWWITSDADTINICSRFDFSCDMQALQFSEWNQNMVVLAIIRAFAESTWQPDEMAFKSSLAPGSYAKENFPNTHILTGQQSAWVSLPRSLLSLPPGKQAMVTQSPSALTISSDKPMDFPASLKLMLQAYIGDGYPTIHLAAELSGTSMRTLQRRLKQFGLSYSELVQHAQFDYAVRLLHEPDIRTIDIAYAVGYTDPSNFARAFRRIAGVSPNEYRQLHQFN
ncbi:MAG: helix-turn-helix domain-containing protein [Gammaproteobacteria bacterium]